MESKKYVKVEDSDFDVKNNAAVSVPSTIGIGTASKPPDRTFCESICLFFYNSEKGSFCSRTPKSWCQIFFFYICFYGVLFGLWALGLYLFLLTLPETDSGPKYMLDGSLIGFNPGVGLKPGNDMSELQSKPNIRQSFTLHRLASSYDSVRKHRNKEYADRLKLFLDEYTTTDGDQRSDENYQKFPLETLGECAQYPYGYLDDLSPCFILSLNKIWDWQPVVVSDEDFAESDWPIQFENHWRQQSDKDFLWFDCDTLHCRKRNCSSEEMQDSGEIEYFPANRGVSTKYFPFKGVTGNSTYHSPLVAIKYKPGTADSVVLECRAFYKGVKHNDRLGKLKGLIQFKVIFQ